VLVEDGKPTQVNASLVPNFYTLEASEKGGVAATLWVDGKQRGALPQTVALPFRDTAVRIVPADPRYQEWTTTVRPAAKGKTERVAVSLQGRMGNLEITTTPDVEAEITLSPVSGAGKGIGTAPLDYGTLIGDYEVSARYSSGGKAMAGTARVTVREGQTTTVRLELSELTASAPSKPAKSETPAPAAAVGTTTPGNPLRNERITALMARRADAQIRLDGIGAALAVNDIIGITSLIGGLVGGGLAVWGAIEGPSSYAAYKAATTTAAADAARAKAEGASLMVVLGSSIGGGLLGISLIDLIARPNPDALRAEIREYDRQIEYLKAGN
jgi:hypothetical protein